MEPVLKFCRFSVKLFKPTYNSLRYYSKEKIVPLNETTLIGRIVLFINNEYNKPMNKMNRINSESEIQEVIDKIKLNQNHISNLKLEQMEELLRTLKYDNYILNRQHFKRLIEVIDVECCSRVDYLDSKNILRILNVFTQSVPNRITEYNFYNQAMYRLVRDVDYLSKDELVQTIFYVGLQKKTNNAQTMLRNCIRRLSKGDINALSVEELCIICNSAFKTSTKIANKQILENVRHILHDKLCLLKDPGLLTILVKTIRHNKYQDENLLNTVSYAIFFNKTYICYPFPVLCHILAMYADYQFYDEELLKLFADLGLKQLNGSTIVAFEGAGFHQDIRIKDITRFLWVLSIFGHKVISKDALKLVITSNIMKRITAGYYRKDVEELVNSILYMWILNYQAIEMIRVALTENNVRNIRDITSQTKSRLNLLLTCMFFENKKLFREVNIKAQKSKLTHLEFQLEKRPSLVKVLEALRQLTSQMAVNKFEITCEVPHLNICGITGYTKSIYKTVYIEVLDDHVCIKNLYNIPIGQMQLKLRILREMDEALIVISSDLIEKFSKVELEEYLKSELELLC